MLYTPFDKWATEEHKLFSESVKRFYEDEMTPHIEEWVNQGKVPKSFWEKAGKSGVMGGAVPEDVGGFGGDIGLIL